MEYDRPVRHDVTDKFDNCNLHEMTVGDLLRDYEANRDKKNEEPIKITIALSPYNHNCCYASYLRESKEDISPEEYRTNLEQQENDRKTGVALFIASSDEDKYMS